VLALPVCPPLPPSSSRWLSTADCQLWLGWLQPLGAGCVQGLVPATDPMSTSVGLDGGMGADDDAAHTQWLALRTGSGNVRLTLRETSARMVAAEEEAMLANGTSSSGGSS
jgi:hypothetical protein